MASRPLVAPIPHRTEARKIRYVRSTGETQVEGIQYFEFTPRDMQNAQRPKPATDRK